MKTLYSIDFDFFVFNGEHTKITLPNGATIPGALMFDWGHNENYSESLQSVMWDVRLGGWLQNNLWLPDYAKVVVDIDEWWTSVLGSFSGSIADDCRFDIADSHTHGFTALDQLVSVGEKASIVSFDAHHDLGYTESDLDEVVTHVNCANWIRAADRYDMVNDVTVIYPDWKGTVEWPDDASDRVPTARCTTWTDWRSTGPHNAPDAIFICRSSAWVPPWCDEDFTELIDWLANNLEIGYRCLDCVFGTSPNACTPREWDSDEHRRNWDERRRLLAQSMDAPNG